MLVVVLVGGSSHQVDHVLQVAKWVEEIACLAEEIVAKNGHAKICTRHRDIPNRERRYTLTVLVNDYGLPTLALCANWLFEHAFIPGVAIPLLDYIVGVLYGLICVLLDLARLAKLCLVEQFLFANVTVDHMIPSALPPFDRLYRGSDFPQAEVILPGERIAPHIGIGVWSVPKSSRVALDIPSDRRIVIPEVVVMSRNESC